MKKTRLVQLFLENSMPPPPPPLPLPHKFRKFSRKTEKIYLFLFSSENSEIREREYSFKSKEIHQFPSLKKILYYPAKECPTKFQVGIFTKRSILQGGFGIFFPPGGLIRLSPIQFEDFLSSGYPGFFAQFWLIYLY